MSDPDILRTSPEGARARTELLGLAGSVCLAAFHETAAASAAAPSLPARLTLAELATGHHDALRRVVDELGDASEAAIAPFTGPVDLFTGHTRPVLWPEWLLKLVVTGGLAGDVVEGIAPHLDSASAELLSGLGDGSRGQVVVRMLQREITSEPELVGRLTLFARRLLGEAISQAQRVAASHPDLTSLITGRHEGRGDDLAAVSDLMAGLSGRHARRMETLGLA